MLDTSHTASFTYDQSYVTTSRQSLLTSSLVLRQTQTETKLNCTALSKAMESGKKTGCFPPCFGSVKKFFKRFCNRTKISPMPTTNRPQAGLTIIDLEESESVQDIIADELNNGSAHLVGDEQKAGSDAEGN